MSIRINTIKTEIAPIIKQFKKYGLNPVTIDWVEEGFYLQASKLSISQTPEHSLGLIYIQDAGSMIPPILLRASEESFVLDMCAAPGSKTTQLSSLMKNKGTIIANDNRMTRIKALGGNLQRCGILNVRVTLGDGRYFGKYSDVFDRVLIDVPCSATGAILEKKGIRENYNLERINSLSEIQKGLLSAGYKSLKSNGVLVYSTCSLEPEENEIPVDNLLCTTDAELEDINSLPGVNLKSGIETWQGKDFDPAIKKTKRIFPHENQMRGYFFAVVRKP